MNRANHKRSHTLKNILELRQSQACGANMLIGTKEDLIDAAVLSQEQPLTVQDEAGINKVSTACLDRNNLKNQSNPNLANSISLFHKLIEKELANTAQQLHLDPEELSAWLDLQVEVPAKTILALLRTMQNLRLDPLLDEIGFTQYEDSHWQVFITVNGCSKLLNQHPQFNGLSFTQSERLIEEVPEWIECSIYRKDRILPITIREYFIEVKAEQAIWQKMPRRMLRHRALQQCVRMAML
jgi:hypothetical protein